MKELIERVLASESTKDQWKNQYNSKEWKDADKLNFEVFGKHLNQTSNCECLEDLFRVMRHRQTKNRIMSATKQRFRIKPNKVIMVHGCKPLTANSTDEEAIKLLKLHQGHIVNFETYPENWEDIVNGNAPLHLEKTEEKEPVETDEPNQGDDQKKQGSTNDEVDIHDNQPPLKAVVESREQELLSLKNSELKKLIPNEKMPEKTTKPELVKTILGLEFPK